MDCRVVVEAAVPVYDVSTSDEAVRIAISKTGEMLNPDLNYVEINMGERVCPHCHETLEPAFLAADESLVALELEMTVFNVEREEHASRIARKEIGKQLEKIPLEVLSVDIIEDDEAAEGDETAEADDETAEADDEAAEGDETAESTTSADAEDSDASTSSDDEPVEAVDDATADGGESSPAEAADSHGDEADADDDDDVLPEFEDLID
jgi:uncharacterized protein (UPF0212 family)